MWYNSLSIPKALLNKYLSLGESYVPCIKQLMWICLFLLSAAKENELRLL